MARTAVPILLNALAVGATFERRGRASSEGRGIGSGVCALILAFLLHANAARSSPPNAHSCLRHQAACACLEGPLLDLRWRAFS
jgi:hypothetical protein